MLCHSEDEQSKDVGISFKGFAVLLPFFVMGRLSY